MMVNITFSTLIAIFILLWIFIYVVSYGLWTWKEKNRMGGFMIFFVALAALLLPLYTLFFRQ